MVGGLDVAGLADGHADGLVALEAHQQELVVAVAEELREAAEDLLDVQVPVRLHHLLDDAEQVGHHLVLAIAQRLVLEQEEADGEAVLEVLHAKELVDGALEDVGEEREVGGEQRLGRRLLAATVSAVDAAPAEEGEALGDGRGVGEPVALRQRPARHVETLARRAGSRPAGRRGRARGRPAPAPALRPRAATRLRSSASRSRNGRQARAEQATSATRRASPAARRSPRRAGPPSASVHHMSRPRSSSENCSSVSGESSSPRTSSASSPNSSARARRRARSRSSCAGGWSGSPRPGGRRCGRCGSTRPASR